MTTSVSENVIKDIHKTQPEDIMVHSVDSIQVHEEADTGLEPTALEEKE